MGGDRLGGPSLCGSGGVETVTPAPLLTRTHPFLNCREKEWKEMGGGGILVIYFPSETAYKYQMAEMRKGL